MRVNVESMTLLLYFDLRKSGTLTVSANIEVRKRQIFICGVNSKVAFIFVIKGKRSVLTERGVEKEHSSQMLLDLLLRSFLFTWFVQTSSNNKHFIIHFNNCFNILRIVQ